MAPKSSDLGADAEQERDSGETQRQMLRDLQEPKQQFQESQEIQELRQRVRELEREMENTILSDYLFEVGKKGLEIKVVNDPKSTTQGRVTKPEHRRRPRLLRRWDDFATGQAHVWTKLHKTEWFNEPRYVPLSFLKHMNTNSDPVSSETSLRQWEKNAVDGPTKQLFNHAFQSEEVRTALEFENGSQIKQQDHSNFPGIETSPKTPPPQTSNAACDSGSADHFYAYSRPDGTSKWIAAVEYKPPHKLSTLTVTTGLQDTQIEIDQYLMNPAFELDDENEKITFHCRRTMAAVITQLFSYMVVLGVSFGHISTGKAYVFLHIDENDQEVVEYAVHIPAEEFKPDIDPDSAFNTPVAHIFALQIRAAQASPRKFDLESLERWEALNDRDILAQIPETERPERVHSSYKPSRVVVTLDKGKKRQLRPVDYQEEKVLKDDDDDDDEDGPTNSEGSPSARGHPHKSRRITANTERSGNSRKSTTSSGHVQNKDVLDKAKYCSQMCLLGLANGSQIDPQCPNVGSHGESHPPLPEFIAEVREQLADPAHATCRALGYHGSSSALIKIRSQTYGYTLVSKSLNAKHRDDYNHELETYEHYLRPIQGRHVPVCLGGLKANVPFHHCGVSLEYFLLMSWGGTTLSAPLLHDIRTSLRDAVVEAMSALHDCGVIHGDLNLNNMGYDTTTNIFMFVDFGQSMYIADASRLGTSSHKGQQRQVLGSLSPNQNSKIVVEGQDLKAMQSEVRAQELRERAFVNEWFQSEQPMGDGLV